MLPRQADGDQACVGQHCGCHRWHLVTASLVLGPCPRMKATDDGHRRASRLCTWVTRKWFRDSGQARLREPADHRHRRRTADARVFRRNLDGADWRKGRIAFDLAQAGGRQISPRIRRCAVRTDLQKSIMTHSYSVSFTFHKGGLHATTHGSDLGRRSAGTGDGTSRSRRSENGSAATGQAKGGRGRDSTDACRADAGGDEGISRRQQRMDGCCARPARKANPST